MSESQTADQPTAPLGKDTKTDNHNTIKVKQPALYP